MFERTRAEQLFLLLECFLFVFLFLKWFYKGAIFAEKWYENNSFICIFLFDLKSDMVFVIIL